MMVENSNVKKKKEMLVLTDEQQILNQQHDEPPLRLLSASWAMDRCSYESSAGGLGGHAQEKWCRLQIYSPWDPV